MLKGLYWATFFPLRVVLYPLVLFWIYKEMKVRSSPGLPGYQLHSIELAACHCTARQNDKAGR